MRVLLTPTTKRGRPGVAVSAFPPPHGLLPSFIPSLSTDSPLASLLLDPKGCPDGEIPAPWFKDSRPCPLSHGVLARLYRPQAALSALRDLASWPAHTVPNHLPLVSLAGQGLVFSSCFFCISVFKKFKFPVVSEESQEGEAAGGKRREEAGENSGGGEGKGGRH